MSDYARQIRRGELMQRFPRKPTVAEVKRAATHTWYADAFTTNVRHRDGSITIEPIGDSAIQELIDICFSNTIGARLRDPDHPFWALRKEVDTGNRYGISTDLYVAALLERIIALEEKVKAISA